MKAIGVIPARMQSSRFPGKPLAKILGCSMIEHVYKRSAMAKRLAEVYVATCDAEIAAEVERVGGRAVMTSPDHQRCTDRVAEAVQRLGAQPELVVNIQGDEPMVRPEQLDALVDAMTADPSVPTMNLLVPIHDEQEHRSPNVVKVVVDREGFILYFSREPIPSRWRGAPHSPLLRQTGIIGFRSGFLQAFTQLSPTPLEQVESVDMLRVLEHGYRVKALVSQTALYTVDTEHDRQLVEQRMVGSQ